MARRTGFFLARESGLMIGLWIERRTLPPLRGPPSSLLSVLATSLHLPTVDTCWAKKGPIGDGFQRNKPTYDPPFPLTTVH